MKSRFNFSLESYDEIGPYFFNKMYYCEYIDSHGDNEEDEYYFFNNLIFNENDLTTKRNGNKQSDKETKHCTHNWKKYVGFTETYYYCEHCDEKSNHDHDISKKWFIK